MDSDTQGRRPNHGPYAHPGTSNAFTVLSRGLTFDREKYGREIDIFERCARAAADARAATEAGVKRVAAVHWPTEYEGRRNEFRDLIQKHYDGEVIVPDDFTTIEV